MKRDLWDEVGKAIIEFNEKNLDPFEALRRTAYAYGVAEVAIRAAKHFFSEALKEHGNQLIFDGFEYQGRATVAAAAFIWDFNDPEGM